MSGGAVVATELEQVDVRRPKKGKDGGGSTEAKAVGSSRWTPYALLTPGFLWLTIFFVVPTLFLVMTSLYVGSLDAGYEFVPPGEWSTYVNALQEYWPQFVRSFVFAGLATIFCLLLAYPLAYFIAFRSGRWKAAMLVLVIAPFFTSFLIRTLAWKTILADDSIVVRTMSFLHITDVLSAVGLTEGQRVLNTPLAVVLGLVPAIPAFGAFPTQAVAFVGISAGEVNSHVEIVSACPAEGFIKPLFQSRKIEIIRCLIR